MREATRWWSETQGAVGDGENIEFLLDDDGNFYFLEMNTRLQVEHPVTECVTGLDLVAWQLDVAAGKALPRTQDEVRLQGHAIEVRLYAEDPYAGFLPQTGPIVRFDPAPGIRVDSGIQSGGEVSAFYDPMLAKLVAHGRDRNEALRKLRRGLRDTVLLGPVTNLGFLQALLDDPQMVAGTIKTDTLDARFATPPKRPAVATGAWAVAALVMARTHTLDPALADGQAWRSSGVLQTPLTLRCGAEQREALVALADRDNATVTLDDQTVALRVAADEDGTLRFECDGVTQTAVYAVDRAQAWVSIAGFSHAFEEPDLRTQAGDSSDGTVRAPLSGTILRVQVEDGASVTRGQLLVTVEAMKMEHRIEAPFEGVARDVTVRLGDQVTGDQMLLRIETKETRA